MKIGTDSFFHLTYCTNIHPGDDWRAIFASLKQYIPALKARLSPDEPFGIGLRLSDLAARELLQGDRLMHFQSWLAEQDLYVFTLNGFPYGGFHRQVVKDQVYAPDWRSPARVDYSLRLARVLAALLPEGMDGSISTVPLSYKPWFENRKAREAALREASLNLALVAAELMRIRRATGKHLHIDLEPEPDCLLENSAETIDFFTRWLSPCGGASLASELGVSHADAEGLLAAHVGVCYDTCHFALQYEQPARVLAEFKRCGIRVGKAQLSAALKVPLPESPQGKQTALERLGPFIDSTYLHQIVERRRDGGLFHYRDLSTDTRPDPAAREWRIHFHVPIFIDDYEDDDKSVYSTQDELLSALDALRDTRVCPHLEIETYTWEVLPSSLKLDLSASIEREYEWVLCAFDHALPLKRKDRDARVLAQTLG